MVGDSFINFLTIFLPLLLTVGMLTVGSFRYDSPKMSFYMRKQSLLISPGNKLLERARAYKNHYLIFISILQTIYIAVVGVFLLLGAVLGFFMGLRLLFVWLAIVSSISLTTIIGFIYLLLEVRYRREKKQPDYTLTKLLPKLEDLKAHVAQVSIQPSARQISPKQNTVVTDLPDLILKVGTQLVKVPQPLLGSYYDAMDAVHSYNEGDYSNMKLCLDKVLLDLSSLTRD